MGCILLSGGLVSRQESALPDQTVSRSPFFRAFHTCPQCGPLGPTGLSGSPGLQQATGHLESHMRPYTGASPGSEGCSMGTCVHVLLVPVPSYGLGASRPSLLSPSFPTCNAEKTTTSRAVPTGPRRDCRRAGGSQEPGSLSVQ